MSKPKVNWRGSFAVIVTPFQKNGAIDEKGYRKVVEFVIKGFRVEGEKRFWRRIKTKAPSLRRREGAFFHAILGAVRRRRTYQL